MEAEFQCTNCEGSGYFDQPDGSERACSVCHGKPAYSPDEIARMEAAEAEILLFKERVRRVAKYYARSSADWVTVLIDLGYQPPFWYPGDREIHDLYRRADALEAEVERLREELAVMEAKYREALRRRGGDL